MTAPVYVIYHDECRDGFGAAYAAFQALGHRTQNGNPVHYLPSKYGQKPPDTDPEGTVYILDFSYDYDTMVELHRKHQGRLTLLDHHKTAMETLRAKVPGCYFDMDKSGAIMAWNFFKGFTPPPEILLYVQDRDLWRWELPHSRAINAALQETELDFKTWANLSIENLKARGQELLAHMYHDIDRVLETQTETELGPHRVPAVETEDHVSETAEVMLERHPEAPFVAVFHHSTDDQGLPITKFSLRSRGDFDVSEVAKAQSGGGHAPAAGFIAQDLNEPDTSQYPETDTRSLTRLKVKQLLETPPESLSHQEREARRKIYLLQLAADFMGLEDHNQHEETNIQEETNILRQTHGHRNIIRALHAAGQFSEELPRPQGTLSPDPERSTALARAKYPTRQSFPKPDEETLQRASDLLARDSLQN